MNGLSWFLYAADMIESLGNKVSIVLFMLIIGIVVAYLTAKANQSWSLIHPDSDGSKKEAALASTILTNISKYIKIFIFLLVVQVILPSERTMYLILGSESVELASMSETGKRVQDAINKKLDEYLTETK